MSSRPSARNHRSDRRRLGACGLVHADRVDVNAIAVGIDAADPRPGLDGYPLTAGALGRAALDLCEAEVAETRCTAFASRRRAVTGRLIVGLVRRLAAPGQPEPGPAWRCTAAFTDSPFPTLMCGPADAVTRSPCADTAHARP
jgi:hypothetical protein